MNVPFTVDQFLNLFAAYNNAVWPMQFIHVLLAFGSVFFAVRERNWSNRFITLTLSFFWIWIGIVYHLIYFTAINPAAYAFALLNILQGVVIFYYGFMSSSLSFRFQSNLYAYTGVTMIIYGLLIYPILGYYFGHVYPQSPTFGLPCPTTIFTFGMLLLTDRRVPRSCSHSTICLVFDRLHCSVEFRDLGRHGSPGGRYRWHITIGYSKQNS